MKTLAALTAILLTAASARADDCPFKQALAQEIAAKAFPVPAADDLESYLKRTRAILAKLNYPIRHAGYRWTWNAHLGVYQPDGEGWCWDSGQRMWTRLTPSSQQQRTFPMLSGPDCFGGR